MNRNTKLIILIILLIYFFRNIKLIKKGASPLCKGVWCGTELKGYMCCADTPYCNFSHDGVLICPTKADENGNQVFDVPEGTQCKSLLEQYEYCFQDEVANKCFSSKECREEYMILDPNCRNPNFENQMCYLYPDNYNQQTYQYY